MRYVLTTLKTILVVGFLLLLNYVLPQQDVARINGTEIIRMDFSGWNRPFFAQSDSGNNELATRDIRLINATRQRTYLLGLIRTSAEGNMVYRNEDTGWIWPPYFKFDSSDLQNSAQANLSQRGAEQWVIVTHYGWRNRFFTIYPNAIGIRPIDDPSVRIIPWFNILFFVGLMFAYFLSRAMWRQFRERKIDPVLDDVSDAYASVEDHVQEKRGRIARWLDTWRSKPKR
ncbi:MAG: DUF1523 family protein [Pseudomonadota bacterium]